MGEGDQKRQLRTPVAFTERMDGIQLRENMGGSEGEVSGTQPAKLLVCREVGKQPLHLSLDVLGITKCTSLLGDPDAPNLSRPDIDVLKQVSVNGAVVAGTQTTSWKGLAESL